MSAHRLLRYAALRRYAPKRLPANDVACRSRLALGGCRWCRDVASSTCRLHGERTLELRGLLLPLGSLEVAVDVGCHLQRSVAEMAAQPRELRAAFKCALGEGVAQRVERPQLARRADPGHLRRGHRGVQMLEDRRSREEPAARSRLGRRASRCRWACRKRPTTRRGARRPRRSDRRPAARGSSGCRGTRPCTTA